MEETVRVSVVAMQPRYTLGAVPSAIVVGAGVFGSSVAHRLAGAGWDVTLVDAEAPGHERSTSGDESRLLRAAHGADAWHTRSARRARTLWRELEAETGASLYVEAGVAWFAHDEVGWEADAERVLRAEAAPVERLEPGAAAERLFPDLGTADLHHVLLEHEAGILRARRATRVLVDAACARGARFVGGRAEPDGGRVRIGGQTLEADRVVWACGPWLATLFPDVVELAVTKQDVLWFAAPKTWRTPDVPGWVDYGGAFYGLGDLDGRGVKAATDGPGAPFDPDSDDRGLDWAMEQAVRRYLRRRFPALADAPLAGHRRCQYELTPDNRFIAAPHPEHPSLWLLGGGSGHGFKHAPALAELAEGWLAGTASPEPMFSLHERVDPAMLSTSRVDPRAVSPDAY
jgi:glycine/D-amino acid oxidase-like deaminating enzyme